MIGGSHLAEAFDIRGLSSQDVLFGDGLEGFGGEGEVHRMAGFVVEKRVFLPHMQNTVYLHYQLLSGKGPLRLKLRPSFHFRGHDAAVSEAHAGPYILTATEDRYEIRAASPLPALRMKLYGRRAAFTLHSEKLPEVLYRIEESRGYEARGELWSAGQFRLEGVSGEGLPGTGIKK